MTQAVPGYWGQKNGHDDKYDYIQKCVRRNACALTMAPMVTSCL